MYGIDTFSWYKLISLKNDGWKELITEILEKSEIFITQEVKKEFDHYFPNESTLLHDIKVLNVSEQEKNKFLEKGYDDADASLLVFTGEIIDEKGKEKIIIITEDHPMLNEGVTDKKNIIQLVDFFKILQRADFVTKREFYHLVKKFRKMKNITKEKEKELIK